MDHLLPAWLALPGHGPLLQAALIVTGTFVLEDAATVLAAMDVQLGSVPLGVALAALYVGIVLGDLGLYGLGALASSTRLGRRWMPPERLRAGQAWLAGNLTRAVFVSRFVPGARLPTYTACGFLGASLRHFAVAAVAATLIWTSLLFGVSLHVGRLLADYLGAWRWIGMTGFAVTIVLIGRVAVRLRGRAA